MSSVRTFDVVVVGGGPAGITAALTAYTATPSVAIVNDGASAGGQIWRGDVRGGRDTRGARWVSALADSQITKLDEATVIDARPSERGHRLEIEQRGKHVAVEATRVILATGARELLLPFPGWTLPGVMGAGAVQAMAKGGMTVRGKRIVVAGTGPLLIAVAASLARRGAKIVGLVEQAPLARMLRFAVAVAGRPAVARDAVGYVTSIKPLAFRFGSWVSHAHGEDRLQAVTITNGRRASRVVCDLACVGYGLVPNTELGRLMGCELAGDALSVDAAQRTSVRTVFAAGECGGIGGVDVALMEGIVAGYAAVGETDARGAVEARDHLRRWGRTIASTFALRPDVLRLADAHTIVCRCEDVRMGDIDAAWSSREAKLYRRVGMGPCQGRVCGAAMQHLRGWAPDRIQLPIQPSLVETISRVT